MFCPNPVHPDKPSDPAYECNDKLHFRSVDVALLTLFRAATLEDWTDVMGCHKRPTPAATTTPQNLPSSFPRTHARTVHQHLRLQGIRERLSLHLVDETNLV